MLKVLQDQKQEGIQLGSDLFRSEYIRQKEKKRENKNVKPQIAANFHVKTEQKRNEGTGACKT